MPKTHWVSFQEERQRANRSGAGLLGGGLGLVERSVRDAGGPVDLLRWALPELATHTGAQWIAVLTRRESWEPLHQIGSLPGGRRLPPVEFLTEVCDRAMGGLREGDGAGPAIAAAPLDPKGERPELLSLSLARLDDPESLLHEIIPLAYQLGLALEICRRHEERTRHTRRLEALLEVTRRLSVLRETEPLLTRLAEEAARLLEAERASIFLWDRPSRQLVARPALGLEEEELRVPDSQGIVGQVVQTGRPIRIDDAYASPDFNPEVDRQLGYRTRNLICVPLRNDKGPCMGAFEVLNKRSAPFTTEDEETLQELAAQAAAVLQNVQEREQLIRHHRQLSQQAAEGAQIIGESPAMAALRSTIERVAATELPVLILGESGTGKEVVSRAIHYKSARHEHPFLPVNCAAITETLLESELFGHEKGAFTDAREMRAGKFELASGGTLFLDEIAELSPGGQAKLLRVLEEKVVYRVGGSRPIPTDTRVLAATNRDLAEAVRQGRFRQDLFFRLSVVTLPIPPLRDRREDLLPLAEFFLEQFCRDAGRKKLKFSTEARRRLQAHSWPGNVRELRNLMERLAFLASGPTVQPEDLAFILSPAASAGLLESKGISSGGSGTELPLSQATDEFQRQYIRAMIDEAGGNMTEAAQRLGLHRSNLYRKMRQLGMNAGE